jgi:hypothetical protein
MELKIMYTERYFNNWPTWPLIYEWEDVIADALKLELADSIKASVTTFYLDKILRFASRNIFGDNRLIIFADKFIKKRMGLYFELLPRSSFYFTGSKNTVPIIIDFSKNIDLGLFYKAYKNCKIVFISNLQAYNYLKQSKCPLNIYHFPQSIADKYKITADTSFKKKFDLIIPGRVDSILSGFLQEYEKKFPGIEYLYREHINGEFFYISNKTGVHYRGHEREEYMNLLRASRVTLYSTVGIDGDEERTGGFSPVTPRFLEMVSAGCHIIARYPINEETQYFELDKICISCANYSLFENELSKALNRGMPDLRLYESYLAKHYTSERVKRLKNILAEIN